MSALCCCNIFFTRLNLIVFSPYRRIRSEVFYKKCVLRNFTKFTGKHLCQSLFFRKETLAQVLSYEFCKISNNTFSYRTAPVVSIYIGIQFQYNFSIYIENFRLQMVRIDSIFKVSKK